MTCPGRWNRPGRFVSGCLAYGCQYLVRNRLQLFAMFIAAACLSLLKLLIDLNQGGMQRGQHFRRSGDHAGMFYGLTAGDRDLMPPINIVMAVGVWAFPDFDHSG